MNLHVLESKYDEYLLELLNTYVNKLGQIFTSFQAVEVKLFFWIDVNDNFCITLNKADNDLSTQIHKKEYEMALDTLRQQIQKFQSNLVSHLYENDLEDKLLVFNVHNPNEFRQVFYGKKMYSFFEKQTLEHQTQEASIKKQVKL